MELEPSNPSLGREWGVLIWSQLQPHLHIPDKMLQSRNLTNYGAISYICPTAELCSSNSFAAHGTPSVVVHRKSQCHPLKGWTSSNQPGTRVVIYNSIQSIKSCVCVHLCLDIISQEVLWVSIRLLLLMLMLLLWPGGGTSLPSFPLGICHSLMTSVETSWRWAIQMGRKSDAACNMLTAFCCHLFKDLQFAGQRSRPFAKMQGDDINGNAHESWIRMRIKSLKWTLNAFPIFRVPFWSPAAKL